MSRALLVRLSGLMVLSCSLTIWKKHNEVIYGARLVSTEVGGATESTGCDCIINLFNKFSKDVLLPTGSDASL